MADNTKGVKSFPCVPPGDQVEARKVEAISGVIRPINYTVKVWSYALGILQMTTLLQRN